MEFSILGREGQQGSFSPFYFLFFMLLIGLKTILDIAAVIEHFTVKSGICGDKKLLAQKQVYHFFGILNGENTLF